MCTLRVLWASDIRQTVLKKNTVHDRGLFQIAGTCISRQTLRITAPFIAAPTVWMTAHAYPDQLSG
jgi:hypothetical protein